jgi:hypothetical protein
MSLIAGRPNGLPLGVLRTDLDLLLKPEIIGEREMAGEMLEEARDRIQCLTVYGNQK